MKFIERTTQLTVLPEGEPIFSEEATRISIEDEAGGEFVSISQNEAVVKVNLEEWPIIVGAVEKVIEEIKKHKTK